jgi:4-hydroxybenzoate polyprenyltransferase/phosphoserine phosphatase
MPARPIKSEQTRLLADQTRESRKMPLCVGLNGTLLCSNVLLEGLLTIVVNPRLLAKLLRLLTHQPARLKQQIAELAMLDPKLLPYNEELLHYLRTQRETGRPLVLATSADMRASRAIADHLGLFDQVICSDGARNLKGEAKAAALVGRFGRRGFIYVSNNGSDMPVWREAHSIIVVNARPAVREKARNEAPVETEFNNRPSLLHSAFLAMRPAQWVKNLLVFVPMFMAHALDDFAAWIAALGMFGAFCVTASGTYILNDLTDLATDRQHLRKRYRPLASGKLPIITALVLAIILMSLGFTISALLSALPLIVTYALMSVSYSLALKRFALADVFVLSALYTLRLLAGGFVTGHPVSLWLLGFSGFLFLGLALLKRSGELTMAARTRNDFIVARRGYRQSDAIMIQILGCASAFASTVVLALYVGSPAALAGYRSSELLWAAVPLILFWQCSLWLSAARGQMDDDPIAYLLRDWMSWIVAGAVLVLYILASLY